MGPEKQPGPSRLQAQALVELGRTQFNSRNYLMALEHFELALKTDPTFTRAHVAKAHALKMLGKPEEAIHVCDEIIAREPEYATAYSTRGSALQALGRTAEAKAAYERAASLAPGNALVLYNFACFWALERDAERCREYLKRAIDLEPGRNVRAAIDPDFTRYREEPWFQELTAFK